jgi:putative hydrolase of the HAD superfamily
MTLEIDALIVDLDGVIRHWDMDHFAETARSFGIEQEVFADIAFRKDLIDAGMVGALTMEQWAEQIGRIAAERHGCHAAEVAAGFMALRWSVDWDVVSLLREVRRTGRTKVALFSNASTRLEADLASVDLHVEFDVVFNSARLGVAKPDPGAFRTVAGLLDVAVERCLFVDDTVPNVEGAREAGMQAEAYVGIAPLRSVLQQAGLLSEPPDS